MSERSIATIGMFDGVHLGHRFLIDCLKSEAVRLSLSPVAFTFGRHPLSIITPDVAPPLLSTIDERTALLHSAGVDRVEILDFDHRMRTLTARDFFSLLHRQYSVDAILLGFNNRIGCDRIDSVGQYRRIGVEVGVDILQAPEYHGIIRPISSSIIRRLLSEGAVEQAAAALSRPYELSGTVVHGKQLGRTIGFPTANIRPDSAEKLIPASGVYAVTVTTPDGIPRPAMLNIGSRPTVDTSDAPISIEAHIFDYDADIYGSTVSMAFRAHLRPERRFPSVEALRAQLIADADAAKKTLTRLVRLDQPD